MSTEILSLGLDVIVLIALGFTIFMAMKLSSSLKNFRMQRDNFATLIRELNANIAAAERSVEGLRSSSKESGKKLSGLIKESKDLADELQLINEAGNNLAKRLEGLAEKNRRAVVGDDFPQDASLNVRPQKENKSENAPAFFIRDPEFEGEANSATSMDGFEWDAEEFEGSGDDLQSQAEKELYEALQQGRRHN